MCSSDLFPSHDTLRYILFPTNPYMFRRLLQFCLACCKLQVKRDNKVVGAEEFLTWSPTERYAAMEFTTLTPRACSKNFFFETTIDKLDFGEYIRELMSRVDAHDARGRITAGLNSGTAICA